MARMFVLEDNAHNGRMKKIYAGTRRIHPYTFLAFPIIQLRER